MQAIFGISHKIFLKGAYKMSSEEQYNKGLKLLEGRKPLEAYDYFIEGHSGEDPFNVYCEYMAGLINILELNEYELFKDNLLNYMNLYIVKLRVPKNSSDKRRDPYYKYGNFGSTGCHAQNLLNIDKIEDRFLSGKANLIMFIQGGRGRQDSYTIQKIPLISHYIRNIDKNANSGCTLYWDSLWNNKILRPLKFKYAYEITQEIGEKINPNFEKEQGDMSKFYSYVRSFSDPVDYENAIEIILDYYRWRQKMFEKHGEEAFIDNDWETLEESDSKKVQKARGVIS